MAVLREIAAVQFFGAKFQKFFGCVSGIRFAVSFGVRLRAAGVRRQRTKRRLSSLARQTASQSPDQTAQSETRCLPAFKTRRQTPQTVVCAVRFTHRSAKRDTKAVENVRLPANIRGALSNLKKTGIIADAVDASDRTAEFCDRMRCRDFLQYAQAVITTKEKEPCTPGHCRWMDTILFRYKNVFKI